MKSNSKIVLSATDKKVIDAFYKYFQNAAMDDSIAPACMEMCGAVNGWLMKHAVDENNRPYAYCG